MRGLRRPDRPAREVTHLKKRPLFHIPASGLPPIPEIEETAEIDVPGLGLLSVGSLLGWAAFVIHVVPEEGLQSRFRRREIYDYGTSRNTGPIIDPVPEEDGNGAAQDPRRYQLPLAVRKVLRSFCEGGNGIVADWKSPGTIELYLEHGDFPLDKDVLPWRQKAETLAIWLAEKLAVG